MNLFLSLIIFIKLFLLIHSAPDRDPWKTCACGELGHYVKIVGGREAKPHSYPWTVALTGFPELGDFFCGATIVSSRFIVTAGHCFYTKSEQWSYDKIRVKLGAHNLTDKDSLILKPKAFKIYEEFTDVNDVDAPLLDIALIELEEDLPISDKIKPVCIHSKYYNYHINDLKSNREYYLKRTKRAVHHKLPFSISNSIDEQTNSLDEDLLDDENTLNSSRVTNEKKLKPLRERHKLFASQASDKSKIVLLHPDKELIRQVIRITQIYYQQIRNDPVLVFDPAKEFTEDELTVVGWGSIDKYDTSILPDVLMETQIVQKKSEVCENAYGDDVFFRSKMVCANDADTDSCNGDSGGPLMTKNNGRVSLYAVVSYGRSCGSYSSPGVYTRLSAFLEWVVLHIIENSKFCPN